ncbi:MAG: 30S ribosomal protein S9 [Planctomycetota bacterium]|nr:MAG: 30S ribosomal protein S9 [Planctomycetota bacterium]
MTSADATTETTAVTQQTEETPAPAQAPRREPKPAKFGWWWGTGRRKTAVARVRVKPGSGQFNIFSGASKKARTVAEHFTEERDRADAVAPLKLLNLEGKMDVAVRVHGGGFMGQAQAIRLGLARALRDYDPTLEHALREAGYLTRDPREVERKKYGQRGARRRFQFSKR